MRYAYAPLLFFHATPLLLLLLLLYVRHILYMRLSNTYATRHSIVFVLFDVIDVYCLRMLILRPLRYFAYCSPDFSLLPFPAVFVSPAAEIITPCLLDMLP